MHWRWLFWWRPPALLKAVIVNLRGSEPAIQGVLWTSRGRWLVLRGAQVLPTQGTPTPADGEILIDRAQVAFIQVLPN